MACKLKIGPSQSLKLKGNAGFALPLLGGNGIATAKSGGIWAVGLDYSKMPAVETVNDDTAYILTWDSASGLFTRLNVTDLKVEFEGTFDGYYQPLDTTLTALAALDGTAGLLAQTGADTFARRTLTGTANEITVTNGDGVSSNPTVSLPAALTFTDKTVTGGTFNSPAINTPTGIVKGDVGLGNADNTSDANKPISTATQTALDAKVAGPASAVNARIAIFNGTTGKVIADGGHVLPAGAVVGTTDAQTLTNKTLTSPAVTTPTGIVKGDVGLGNVDNTSDAAKWSATATLTNKTFDTAGTGNSFSINGVAATTNTGTGAVVRAVSPALTGTPTAPTATGSDNSTKIATTAYVDAQVASGVAGVASIDGATGTFTIGGLFSRSTNLLQVLAATKSEQQTGTSNTVAVTPLHQQDHDSGCKAWVSFTGQTAAGSCVIDAGYNVASVTKTSTAGVYTVAFTTAFASANYCCFVASENTSVVAPLCGILSSTAKTASQVTIFFENAGATTGQEPVHGYVQCFGRQ